ncbi:multiheme c-type cytochrome [Flavobacterium aquicola]|uniref:Cytochrome c554/c'-like protein n=1 Tax=Flavobacterium aquicola TaxID=1682742 RepID=A0A3E0ELX2_9FLAO|nr:multiheme c-type cytochrome [Flavobacterium aquicola]REG99171.1 cytochrome c554/c'-like protein [Flavobacterium aquicola]
MKKIKILFAIIVLAVFLVNCTNKSDEYIDPRGTDYAGPESCIQCHQVQYESATHSAHFKATSPANKENILGHFTNGHNTFVYDKNTKLVIEERNDSLYQVIYKNGKEVEAYAFDVIFGIKHAQTSGYWKNHYVYELPISYYKSIDNWATSPTYSATTADFTRKINKECFACHSSNISSRFITTKSTENYTFMGMEVEDFLSKSTLLYGIDCERCHGPAKKHVQAHLKFPDIKKAQYIVAFSHLNRQQRIDACALCHSGNNKSRLKSRYQYKPGESLMDYFTENPRSRDTLNMDVHGNQLGLLSQSKCFQKSVTMDCMTCHNPHQDKPQNHITYSKICMSCHLDAKHSPTTQKTISTTLSADNCVECHMPKQDSRAIRFQESNSSKIISYSLRTHKIGTYTAVKK